MNHPSGRHYSTKLVKGYVYCSIKSLTMYMSIVVQLMKALEPKYSIYCIVGMYIAHGS